MRDVLVCEQLHAEITCGADVRLETEITVGHVPLAGMQMVTPMPLGAQQVVPTSLPAGTVVEPPAPPEPQQQSTAPPPVGFK